VVQVDSDQQGVNMQEDIDAIIKELEALGFYKIKYNTRMSLPIANWGSMTSGRLPRSAECSYPVIEFEFMCAETDIAHLYPLIRRHQQVHTPIPASPRIFSHHEYELLELKTVTEFCCTMEVEMMGGPIEPFLEHFREVTKELYYEMESKAFDKAVEDVLTEE